MAEKLTIEQEIAHLKKEIAQIKSAIGLTTVAPEMPSCQKCGNRIDAMAGAKCTDPTCPIGLHEGQANNKSFI